MRSYIINGIIFACSKKNVKKGIYKYYKSAFHGAIDSACSIEIVEEFVIWQTLYDHEHGKIYYVSGQ